MNEISLSLTNHFTIIQLGGKTNGYGASKSNWFMWNPINMRYEARGLTMADPHNTGDFTRIPEDAKILEACNN